MKKNKLMITLSILILTLTMLAGCMPAAAEAEGASPFATILMTMFPLIVLFVMMYFVSIRPENKRRKKAQEMRDSVEVGDKISTIGGIVGKVVHVTNDKITFETGEDRVRLEVYKWAISANEGKGANKELTDSQETLSDR